MKIVVLIFLMNPGHLLAQIQENPASQASARTLARIEDTKEIACEYASNRYASISQALGAVLASTLSQTESNSRDRTQALADINLTMEKFENSDASSLKESERTQVEKARWGKDSELEISFIRLFYSTTAYGRKVALYIPFEYVGRPAETYRRLITEKCMAPRK